MKKGKHSEERRGEPGGTRPDAEGVRAGAGRSETTI